jgi:hypothetical protein
MADAVNAGQRNLYPRRDGSRYSLEYRDGRGYSYVDQQRQLSWSVPTDVPAIGQHSALTHLPELRQVKGLRDGVQLIHPTTYTKLRHTDHLSFSKSQDDLGVGVLGSAPPPAPGFDPWFNQNVHPPMHTTACGM